MDTEFTGPLRTVISWGLWAGLSLQQGLWNFLLPGCLRHRKKRPLVSDGMNDLDTGSSSGTAMSSDQNWSLTSASGEHNTHRIPLPCPAKEGAKDKEITGSLLIISSFSCDLWVSTVLTTPVCTVTQPNPAGTQWLFLASGHPLTASTCIQ